MVLYVMWAEVSSKLIVISKGKKNDPTIQRVLY